MGDGCEGYDNIEVAKMHCDKSAQCTGVVDRGGGRFEMRTGKSLVRSTKDTAHVKRQCLDCPGARKRIEEGYSICRAP